MIYNYPSVERVIYGDRYQICKWYRHLRSAENENEIQIQKLIYERFNELGGFTPELSKLIGW